MDYTKWETEDGIILNIKDMTTDHIKNCISFIKKESKKIHHVGAIECLHGWFVKYGQIYIDSFEKELESRAK